LNRRHVSALQIVCLFTVVVVASACVPGQPTPIPPPPATLTPMPPTVVQPKPPPPTQPPPTQPPPTELPPTEVQSPPPPPPPPPPTLAPPPSVEPETRPFYEDRSHPVSLLASYVNALNRGEFARAWDYWENPPNPSFADFQNGYADTAFVLLAVHPPTWYDGAAGSAYAEVPTLLLATHTDASQHNFVGCYVARSSNVEGASPGWWLFDATVSPTPGNSADANLLVGACTHPSPGPSGPAYEERGDPVQLLASYFNAINLGDYARAWGYWENPPNPDFTDFQNGYADTDSVFLVVRPPVSYDGAAGSAYGQVPSIMLATHTDASQHNFLGCYVARSPNLGPDAGVWSLNNAAVQALPGGAVNAVLLAGACDGY
jgi:hypothetical protein